VKSKDDSRYLVLLVKPWDKCEATDKYLTMTLKFHTDAGAQMWSSISEQMIEKLEGLKKPAEKEEQKESPVKKREEPVEDDDDTVKKLAAGTYTIVSSKVDWVSFWSELNEKNAHRTLLPVNSVVQVTSKQGKDSRGKMRTECKVIHLYYPQFSELAEDEVPENEAVGWIKGNYLARRAPNMPIVSADERVDPKQAKDKYEQEVVMMENAFKEIGKLTGLDRALALRAIRVTLQHVIINPYRPRRLKRSNQKHANIFLHECGPALLAVVGFEVEGDKELYLPSAVAKTDLAKLILQRIAEITKEDLQKGQLAPKAEAAPAPAASNPAIDPQEIVTLNVGGTKFSTQRKNLMACTKLNLDACKKMDDGAFFIDRDPDLFKSILKYLRDPTRVPSGQPPFLEDLAEEAVAYGINPLVTGIKDTLDKMHTQYA